MTIQQTIKSRGQRYGSFGRLAEVNQRLKREMVCAPNWSGLPDDMKESLEMIALKVSRILSGDPDYIDNWHDIIGYAKLIEDRLSSGEGGNGKG